MSAKIQFSWKNQKGYGLALIFYGWALILQIPAFLHSFLILKLNTTSNDIYLYAGIIITSTALLGSLLATFYENIFDPFINQFMNIHSVVIIFFVIFYFFYFMSVPFIEALEPYLGVPRKLDIFGWTEYSISVVSGLIGTVIIWYISEKIKK